jgi:hypothetical protein
MNLKYKALNSNDVQLIGYLASKDDVYIGHTCSNNDTHILPLFGEHSMFLAQHLENIFFKYLSLIALRRLSPCNVSGISL